MQGAAVTWTREGRHGRGRVVSFSVILAKRGSPTQGLGSTSSLPRWNQQGDSRAERENDSRIESHCRYRYKPTGGFFGRLRLPLNDSRIFTIAPSE